jgi:hypothetical protein
MKVSESYEIQECVLVHSEQSISMWILSHTRTASYSMIYRRFIATTHVNCHAHTHVFIVLPSSLDNYSFHIYGI